MTLHKISRDSNLDIVTNTYGPVLVALVEHIFLYQPSRNAWINLTHPPFEKPPLFFRSSPLNPVNCLPGFFVLPEFGVGALGEGCYSDRSSHPSWQLQRGFREENPQQWASWCRWINLGHRLCWGCPYSFRKEMAEKGTCWKRFDKVQNKCPSNQPLLSFFFWRNEFISAEFLNISVKSSLQQKGHRKKGIGRKLRDESDHVNVDPRGPRQLRCHGKALTLADASLGGAVLPLGGGNSHKPFFGGIFTTQKKLGKILKPFWLAHNFSKWVGSTTNQIGMWWPVIFVAPWGEVLLWILIPDILKASERWWWSVPTGLHGVVAKEFFLFNVGCGGIYM